MSQKWQRRTVC